LAGWAESADEPVDVNKAYEISESVDGICKTGRCEDALPLAKQGLTFWEKDDNSVVIAINPDKSAWSLNVLAQCFHSQKDYAHAEPLYKRALAILRGAHTGLIFHQETILVMNNLALLYVDQGRYEDALALSLKDLWELEHNPSLPAKVLLSQKLNVTGLSYFGLGRYEDAEPILTRALTLREETLGSDHPSVVTSIITLAALYKKKGDSAQAESLFRRAAAIEEKVNGKH
jgi:tetratricopeptide (TPR) repeat protein